MNRTLSSCVVWGVLNLMVKCWSKDSPIHTRFCRLDVPNIFIYNRTTTRVEEPADHFMKSAPTVKKDTPSTNARNVKHRVAVLKSMNDPWPSGFGQPTIIISCVPAHSINGSPAPNITLPIPWLQSVNGGVILEVSLHIYDMDLFD